MQHQKNWTIIEIRKDGERAEILTEASHAQALSAIRAAIHGEAESQLAQREQPAHELSLAA